MNNLKKLFIFVLCFVVVGVCFSCKKNDNFSKWNQNCTALKTLQKFVDETTNPDNEDFIPEANRIAVFDLDGTLFCEKFPIYFEWLMFAHRVLDDPAYKDKASADEIRVAKEIRNANQYTHLSDTLEKEEAEIGGKAYDGMSLEDYWQYVYDFMDTNADGFVGMTKGKAFYEPMKEIINYLDENNFEIYIVSGTDELLVKALIHGVYPKIPVSHVIGMDYSFHGEKQGDIDGLDYVYKKDEKIVRGSKLITKNVKMNKVTNILKEIDQYPCLAFGNSTGDESMLNLTVDNKYFKSLAFIIKCDDTEREYGDIDKANKIQQLADQRGWHTISMKEDWKTIYSDNVKKSQLR